MIVQWKGVCWICGSQYIPSSHAWTISFTQCYEQLLIMVSLISSLTIPGIVNIIHCRINLKFDDYLRVNLRRSHKFSIRCKLSSVSAYHHSFCVGMIFFEINFNPL